MDSRLHKSNRLPGSEKLTRPEEIGQLSKYLKSIRESYDESIRLEDQVLGVSGVTTGKIPKIDELPKTAVKRPGKDLTSKLVEGSLKVPDNAGTRKSRLEDKQLKVPEKQKKVELEKDVTKIPGKVTAVNSLEDKRLGIEDKRQVKLEDKLVEGIGEKKNPALRDKRLDIEAPVVTSLENKRLNLEDNRKVELGDKRLGLEDQRIPELEDKMIGLEDNRIPELDDTRLDLKDERQVELEKKRLDIEDEGIKELENKRIKLSADNDVELEDTRINLTDDRNINLPDKKIEINDDRKTELGDKKIKLHDDRNPELPNKKVKLWDDRKTELPDKKIGLNDDRETELSDKKVGLNDDRETQLSNTKVQLTDDREIELGDKKIGLTDDREVELGNKKLELWDDRENELSNKRLDLTDERENQLGDKRIDLEDERENSLGDKRIDLTDDRENELTNKRIDLTDERENQLEDKILNLSDDREIGLEDKRLNLEDGREIELEDKRIELEDEREPSLSDKILNLTDDRETELEDKRLERPENENGEPEELYDQYIGMLENENGEPEELYDQYIGMLDNQNESPDRLPEENVDLLEDQNPDSYTYNERIEDKIVELVTNEGPDRLPEENVDLLEDQNPDSYTYNDELEDKIIDLINKGVIRDAEDLKGYVSDLDDAELYELAMKVAHSGKNEKGETSEWVEKVEGLMSAYLSSDILLPERAIEFRDAINNTLQMGYFGNLVSLDFRQNNTEGNGSKDSYYTIKAGEKSKPIPFPESQSETIKDGDVESLKPGFLRVPIDTSSGTTWAKAESAIPETVTGSNRRDALDEMIIQLVNYKKSNLPRIPGSDLIDAAKGAIKNVVGVVTGQNSHPNPMNKPLHMDGVALPGGFGDTIYQAANNRTNLNTIDPVGDTVGTIFYDRYWNSESFKTTLEELCPIIGKAPVASLTELKAILKASPYITTPGKFMTDTKGSYNTYTLDTNMYWEVVMEPFVMDKGDCSNGGFSYLPSIREINYENKTIHKVSTNYGNWAPISSFELQKTKLTTKSLQLYEGEIVYPVGMEFTNELRLTFVDDSWKSWRRYFEKCAKVAVFNSYPHKASFYQKTNFLGSLTNVDMTNVCIAPYKNIAFNIRIYILNPQLNQLKKFNLLCVLKDFSEEYVGEIDSGGTDLNVSFSIVGENPSENNATNKEVYLESVKNLAVQTALEVQKRVSNAINSSISLI